MAQIKESELAVASGIASNDFVRMVTSGGDSKIVKAKDSILVASQGYGVGLCSSSTATMTVDMEGYVLKVGGIITIQFANGVPAGATLNMNGQGDIPIYCGGAPIQDGVISAGEIAMFVYDGAEYVLMSVQYRQPLFKKMLPSDMIVTQQFTKDNISVGANNYSSQQTINIAKSNYTPLMANIRLGNATCFRYSD